MDMHLKKDFGKMNPWKKLFQNSGITGPMFLLLGFYLMSKIKKKNNLDTSENSSENKIITVVKMKLSFRD